MIYNDPTHALPYWIIMTDNCLDDNAQFRYNDTEILWHIETGGALFSTSHPSYRNLIAIYVAISTAAKNNLASNRQHFKQAEAGSLNFYNDGICAQPDRSTYVYRRAYCDRSNQMFTFGKKINKDNF